MHFTCAWHTKAIYVSKFQVNTVTNIADIRQNVFSHARVMVIGVRSDLNTVMYYAISFEKTGEYALQKRSLPSKNGQEMQQSQITFTHQHTATRGRDNEHDLTHRNQSETTSYFDFNIGQYCTKT